ncbi:MAG: hypothetical protein ACXVV5_21730 [Solirubrobacteraceae bacterium]
MSEFFEPPPPSPEPQVDVRQPPWFGAPRGILPGVVPVELLVARSEKAAVCITRLAAYLTGFEFDVLTIAAPGHAELDLDPMLFGPYHHRARRPSGELPADLLRIGVQFADGTKVTNTGGVGYDQNPPPGPVMFPGGGGGGDGQWRQTEWVWPLPPSGPLTFVCEWPAAEIPLSRANLDAQIILDAAGRAQTIFPEISSSHSSAGSWSSYAPLNPTKPPPQPHSE